MVRKCHLNLPHGHSYPGDAYAWDVADVLVGPDIVLAGEEVTDEVEPEPKPKKKEIKKSKRRKLRTPKKLNIGKPL